MSSHQPLIFPEGRDAFLEKAMSEDDGCISVHPVEQRPSGDRPKYFHELPAQWQSEVFKLCNRDYDLVVSRVWFWHQDKWCSYQV